MKTIEREETKTQTQTPFQAKDVLSQVVIAALAVAITEFKRRFMGK